jgi:thiol-disulfide isomerase/thioredoxin
MFESPSERNISVQSLHSLSHSSHIMLYPAVSFRCGYCKRMAPDWEQLAEEYKDSKFGLVAEVDCTAEGQPLCEANGVGGYPTIMYGDPSDLEKYQGGRSYEELKDFAEEYIIPFCSPANMELCDDEQKADILKFQAMPDEELVKAIEEKEAEIEKAESQFEEYAEEINNKYDQAWEAKEATIEAIKASGLKLMKVVKAQKEVQVGSDEL